MEELLKAIERMIELGGVSGDHFTTTAYRVEKVQEAARKLEQAE